MRTAAVGLSAAMVSQMSVRSCSASGVQTTHATRGDTLRLIRDLLSEDQWLAWPEEEQNRWWMALEWDMREAEDRPLAEILPSIESLFRRKTFDEPERVKIVVARLMRSGALRSQHRSGRG